MPKYKVGDRFEVTAMIVEIDYDDDIPELDTEVGLVIVDLEEVKDEFYTPTRIYTRIDHLETIFNPVKRRERLKKEIDDMKTDMENKIKELDKYGQ